MRAIEPNCSNIHIYTRLTKLYTKVSDFREVSRARRGKIFRKGEEIRFPIVQSFVHRPFFVSSRIFSWRIPMLINYAISSFFQKNSSKQVLLESHVSSSNSFEGDRFWGDNSSIHISIRGRINWNPISGFGRGSPCPRRSVSLPRSSN